MAREINDITIGWDVVQLLVNMGALSISMNNHLMSVKIGTPLGQRATKVLRCGSRESGKEVASNFRSWALQASRKMTEQLTSALGGKGLFGVELFSGVMK